MSEYLGIERIKFNRDFCAFYHISDMDSYFNIAEKNGLDTFWNDTSIFYEMFRQLDISYIIELACGRGRHVDKYKSDAKKIVLVDILQKNIDICKERFGGDLKIQYYKNDGYDLKQLEDEAYTALFSYDAMVHFEMMDIYSYLKDIYRVLKKGGEFYFIIQIMTKIIKLVLQMHQMEEII